MRLHPKEVAFILDDADVRVVFVTDEIDTTSIAAERSGATRFVDVEGSEYRKLLHSEPLSVPVSDSAQAPAWLYTSGTTDARRVSS